VFGVLRVLNLAHGSFMMLGAYLTAEIAGHAARTGDFVIALVAAPLVVALLGVLLEAVLLKRVYARPELHQLLLMFGLVFVLWGLVVERWGTGFRRVAIPDTFRFSIPVLDRAFPGYYVVVWAVSVAIGVGLWLLLSRSRLGWQIRAAAENPEVAALAGINTRRLFTMVFGLGAWLAGVAGVLLAPLLSLSPNIDQPIILQAFIIVVMGGMGSVGGSLIGALLLGLGLLNAVGVQLYPRVALALPFALMAIILILRPQGLLGRLPREI
jgi:branched-chain amino acid transport system permease protein